jgi:hypothetical protein
MGNKDDWPREKRWKDLYLRSAKLARAKQLGFDYPRTTEKQLVQEEELARTDERLKVLFVCSRNQWRSPTAEQIWRKHPQLLVRSGGTSPNARHKVSVEDIRPKRATIARSSSISTSGGSLRTPRASWSKPTPRPASTKARSTPQIHRSLKTHPRFSRIAWDTGLVAGRNARFAAARAGGPRGGRSRDRSIMSGARKPHNTIDNPSPAE